MSKRKDIKEQAYLLQEQIRNAERRYAEIKAELKSLKEDVPTRLLEIFKSMDEEDAAELATSMYWEFSGWATAIRKAWFDIGYSGNIPSRPKFKTCVLCDAEIPIFSKTKLDNTEASELCDICRKIVFRLDSKWKDYELDSLRAYIKIKKDLITMPYSLYLQTDHWKEVRQAAKKKVGHRCQLCNSYSDLHVHHKTYENRGFETLQDLTVLCGKCHAKFHDIKILDQTIS